MDVRQIRGFRRSWVRIPGVENHFILKPLSMILQRFGGLGGRGFESLVRKIIFMISQSSDRMPHAVQLQFFKNQLVGGSVGCALDLLG